MARFSVANAVVPRNWPTNTLSTVWYSAEARRLMASAPTLVKQLTGGVLETMLQSSRRFFLPLCAPGAARPPAQRSRKHPVIVLVSAHSPCACPGPMRLQGVFAGPYGWGPQACARLALLPLLSVGPLVEFCLCGLSTARKYKALAPIFSGQSSPSAAGSAGLAHSGSVCRPRPHTANTAARTRGVRHAAGPFA